MLNQKRDLSSIVGALFMLVFAVIAYMRWTQSGRVFFLLLLFRDLVFAWMLYFRAPTEKTADFRLKAFSYLSTMLPLFYQTPAQAVFPVMILAADILTVLGFTLATLATIELGKNIGVSPAKRGPATKSGVYKILSHPMYVGYGIAEFGWVLLNPINVGLYVFSLMGYFVRSKNESKLLIINGKIVE